MNLNNLTDIDLLMIELEFFLGFLFFIFLMQIKREIERIEEEELLKMLKKKTKDKDIF